MIDLRSGNIDTEGASMDQRREEDGRENGETEADAGNGL